MSGATGVSRARGLDGASPARMGFTDEVRFVAAAALCYVRLGYEVFPLLPGQKRPSTPHGFHDASLDPVQVRKWWRQNPSCNVGLVPPEAVLVLDVDDGDLLPRLLERFPELILAPMHRTPRGGAHLFVRLGVGWVMPARVGVVPGVDVRGLGKAYVVAPPSVVNGTPYTVARPLVPSDRLPCASRGLLDFLKPTPAHHTTSPAGSGMATLAPSRARSYGLMALKHEAAVVAGTPEGRRNDRLNRAAFSIGGLVAAGMVDKSEAQEALVAAAAACGLPAPEALRTIASGLIAGMARPRVVSLHSGAQGCGVSCLGIAEVRRLAVKQVGRDA